MTTVDYVDTSLKRRRTAEDGEIELLLWGCRNGRLENPEDAVRLVEYRDKGGCSALHYASAGGNTRLVLHLLNAGIGVNSTDKRLRTALHMACQHGDLTMATCLLEECGAVVSEDEDGCTSLHLCVRNPELVKYNELIPLLVRHGAQVNAKTKREQTALHFACKANLVEAVECLISLKADVDVHDKNELSPLLLAAIRGSVDVIPILVQNGADVNSRDSMGRTPLHAACSEGHEAVVTTLISLRANQAAQDKEGNIPLQRACQYGHFKIAHFLIERGSDIHSTDKNGQAPLHKACKGKDTEERRDLIRYLLSKGANINLQSKFSRCALHCTCEDGNLGAATILLKNQCNPHLKDNEGCTPLHYAAVAGFSKFSDYNEIVGLLLEHGSRPNEPNKMKLTSVHIASKMGIVDIVQRLLKFGGDPNLLCQVKKSALHYAVLGDPPRIEPNVKVVECLLASNNVDLNIKDEQGNTPLHYASMHGNLSIVNLLVTKGASAFEKNNMDKLPEDVAAHVGVKNILLSSKQCSIYSQGEGMVSIPSVKLYLTGYKEAGKTTMRKKLGKVACNQPPSMHKRSATNQERTAGIEIECIEHDAFGTLVVHDMAGHCEYSTSHSVVIDCAETSVFMVIFDITKGRKSAWTQANHWSAFIKAGRYKGSRPRVMLVATHIDQAKEVDVETEYNITFTKWKESYSNFFRIIDGPFMVNTLLCESTAMSKIRSEIGKCCEEIKATVKVPVVCFDLMNALRSTFGGKLAMKVEEVISKIQDQYPSLAKGSDELQELLRYLSVMGMILFLQCGWVIFMKEALLEDIFGMIFAPQDIFDDDLSKFHHAMIPTVEIKGLFDHMYSAQLVLDILCELMLGKVDKNSDGEYIHIPSLLKHGTKNDYWKQDSRYEVFGGLRAKCSDATDIFSPCSFSKLQVVLLNRMSYCLTLWANGVCLVNDRVQVMISMETNRRSIDILVRGESGTETQCYRLRQEMWETVRRELQISSSGVSYFCEVIKPLDIKNGNFKDLPFAYNLNFVLECERKGNTYVYANGRSESRDSIRELLYCNCSDSPFNIENDFPQRPPTDNQLLEIAQHISDCWYDVGIQIGTNKSVLDRIQQDHAESGAKRQAFEMLHMAYETPCFTTCADLARLLFKTNKPYVVQYLQTLSKSSGGKDHLYMNM